MLDQNPNQRFLRAFLDAGHLAVLDQTGDLPVQVRTFVADDLRSRIRACAAYVPAQLVRTQQAVPLPGRVGGAFWDGSLLFADMSGFTALSESLSKLGRQGAEEISALINRLFSALVAELQHYHGTLLKFGGDAITAFFDAEELGERHAAAAVSAALAMQQRMQEFADLQLRVGSFTLRLRVGVHSGRVFAAEVGDTSHVELVVTGPEVNRVAQAQEIAHPGEVVVSEHTAALLADARCEPRDAGFLRIDHAAPFAPALPSPQLSGLDTGNDLATLERMAGLLAALQPYLVRNLPRRYLELSAETVGEFRPVSVLFANFYEFSSLLAHCGEDADRAAAALNAYMRRAQAVVHHYGGIVNKVDMYTHGDKLMALFGAPVAHEDDPTRAVRCALELAGALAEANAEIAELLPNAPLLQQRVGINTGVVFAGRVGGATRYEYTVMGSNVNLAARLMSAAPDGAVYLSPSSRAAVAGQFRLENGPALQLKGLPEPIVPAIATHYTGGSARTEEKSTRATELKPTALIGRDGEVAQIRMAAVAALNGSGGVIALVGDAGSGKSRLFEELFRDLVVASVERHGHAEIPHFNIVIGACESYEQRTPYAALRAPIRDLLTLGGDRQIAPAEMIMRRVEQLAPELARFAPLLADAIGVGPSETPLTSALTDQQRHDRLQELLTELFIGLSALEPLVLALDDLHWIDSASLELLGRLAGAISGKPLLVTLSYRPDPPISEPWIDLPHSLRVSLSELTTEDGTALLAALLGGDPPAEVLPFFNRTQGNPFFIEELARALINKGVLVRDAAGVWSCTQLPDEVELPRSIEGLLLARLDRLDEARQELLQVASVIGRRFPRPVVEGVYGGIERLDQHLQWLIASELIQAEQMERVLSYLFRHALLRDVTYEGILYARRHALHARVARRIEMISQDQLDENLALLAWHYLQAEEWLPALDYHVRAGEQAQRRFANTDALALYRTALEILPRIPGETPTHQHLALEADLRERCGDLSLILGEYDAAEEHYRRSLDRYEQDMYAASAQLRLCRAIAVVYERRSAYDDAFVWIERGMARATRTTRAELARCYLLGAGIYQRQGQYERSLEWANLGLRIAEELGSPREQAEALILLGGTYRNLGDNLRAFDLNRRCVELLQQTNDLGRLADAHNNLAVISQMLGRYNEALEQFAAGARIKEEIGDIYGQALIANNLGELLRQQGDLESAIVQYARSLEIFTRLKSNYASGVLNMNLGATYLIRGDLAAADIHLNRSDELFHQVGAEDFLPELVRYQAESLLHRGDLAGARETCERSLAHASRLNARSEEGVSRRLLGEIYLAAGDLEPAWSQLEQSLELLLEADSPYEIARTRLVLADLAPLLGRAADGQAALDAATATMRELGARHELTRAATIAQRHNYRFAA
jgi:class 3 adenylate cyclase/predicted ATPase